MGAAGWIVGRAKVFEDMIEELITRIGSPLIHVSIYNPDLRVQVPDIFAACDVLSKSTRARG